MSNVYEQTLLVVAERNGSLSDIEVREITTNALIWFGNRIDWWNEEEYGQSDSYDEGHLEVTSDISHHIYKSIEGVKYQPPLVDVLEDTSLYEMVQNVVARLGLDNNSAEVAEDIESVVNTVISYVQETVLEYREEFTNGHWVDKGEFVLGATEALEAIETYINNHTY